MSKQINSDNILPESMASPLLTRKVVMFPIWFFQCYLTITVIVFAFGPWTWPVPDPLSLYLFLFCAQFALWFGYRTGLNFNQSGYYGTWRIDSMIKISLMLNLAWIVPNFMLRMNLATLNLSDVLDAIARGFLDPGTNYLSRAAAFSELEKTPFWGYIALLISPVLWLLFPLGVVYWNRLTRVMRWIFVFIVVADLLSWVAIGTNKGIADFVLLLPWLLIARSPELIADIRPARIFKLLVTVSLGLVLLFGFFSLGMSGRGHASIPTYDDAAKIGINRDNWIVSLLPSEGQAAVAMFTSYLVQGYYALSLALEEPFVFSYGVGNSYYLTGLVQHFVGEGVVSNKTYPARIEKYGWDRFNQWHSFYTWIASDVSFPGTIVVVFLIGRLFAMVWLDVLRKNNPFAVALFALLIIMLFYFPANNQVLAFSGTANPFFVLLVCWILTRKRYVVLTQWRSDSAGTL